MLQIDEALQQRLTAQVGRIESGTGAELVLVLAGRSGGYGDLPLWAGMAAAWATLAFLCWSPWSFDAMHFPLDVAAFAGLAALIVARQPRLWPWMAGAARMERQVRTAASAAFHQETVHSTADRVGVLVYVSALEGRVELLPDQGLLGRIGGKEWAEIRLSAGSSAELEAGLERLGALLGRHIPRAADDRNELPDAPRVYR